MIPGCDFDHVALASERHADFWPRYAGDLGGEWVGDGPGAGFSYAQLRYANGMKVELLEPGDLRRSDFLRRFLDRSGPGAHHLTFKVPDLEAALVEVEAAGYRPVGVDTSNPNWKEGFLHPKDAPGVVVQLAQGGSDVRRPPPAALPARRAAPAVLLHVALAVADLEEGLRLFAALLGGREAGRGTDTGGRWVDLEWSGAGRLRLLQPTSGDHPLTAELAGHKGRVHHLAFALDAPDAVPGAVPAGDGVDVPPGENLGTRLRLHAR